MHVGKSRAITAGAYPGYGYEMWAAQRPRERWSLRSKAGRTARHTTRCWPAWARGAQPWRMGVAVSQHPRWCGSAPTRPGCRSLPPVSLRAAPWTAVGRHHREAIRTRGTRIRILARTTPAFARTPSRQEACPKATGWCCVDVSDIEQYKRYVAASAAPFARFETRLVRAGTFTNPEGSSRGCNVVIEFPSYQAALDCYHSPGYQAAHPAAHPASVGDGFIIEGYDGPRPG